MIEIHLLFEMTPLRMKADREKYDEIRKNIKNGSIKIWIGDFLINFNNVTYMEYVEK